MKYFETLPDVISVPELAEFLQIGKNTAYSIVKNGDIRSFRIGKSIRITQDALNEYLKKAK